LVNELEHAGALVDDVVAYHTFPVAGDDEQGRRILGLLQAQQLDILTFTSSSTVRHFMQWLAECEDRIGSDLVQLITRNPQLRIACIGPITSQTARELGLVVHYEAKEFTIAGLVEAIVSKEA
jgi:uroporphyrinogen III methyltransferase/synthase